MDYINIFDKNFIPYDPCSTHGKVPKFIRYVTGKNIWNGVTLYTDHCYDMVTTTNSKFKVAWQVESPVHSDRHFYPAIKKYWKLFDYIFTYDENLVLQYPDKCKRINFAGTTVNENKWNAHKSKLFCIIHSGKKDTPNHGLRQYIIENLSKKYNIDVYGRVTGKPFGNIQEVYKDYRFPIVIENIDHINYFSEKLTDALGCGCVPIYKGTCVETYSKYFKSNGIKPWSTLDELKDILDNIQKDSDEFELNYLNARGYNYNITHNEFYTNEDWLYVKYLNDIIKKVKE